MKLDSLAVESRTVSIDEVFEIIISLIVLIIVGESSISPARV